MSEFDDKELYNLHDEIKSLNNTIEELEDDLEDVQNDCDGWESDYNIQKSLRGFYEKMLNRLGEYFGEDKIKEICKDIIEE